MIPKREVTWGFTVGRNYEKKYRKIEYEAFNGIAVAGSSGSGKSQSLAYWLTQLCYKGYMLVPCEYDGAYGITDSLFTRMEHLEPAFLQPFAVTTSDILQSIKYIESLIEHRRKNPQEFHYPVMLVIDEFSSFYISNTQRLSLDRLLHIINTGRKYHVRTMLAGQTWSQINSNHIAQIREACNTKIIHRIGIKNLGMLISADSTDFRIASQLKTGYVYFNGEVLYVPSQLDHEMKLLVHEETKTYADWYRGTAHLSKEELLHYLILEDKNILYKDTRAVEIRALLEQNPNMSARAIYNHIGGNKNQVFAIIRDVKNTMQTAQ